MNYFFYFLQLCVGSYIQYVFHETYRKQHHVEMQIVNRYVLGTLIFCLTLLFVPQAYFFVVYIVALLVLPIFVYNKQENDFSSILPYYGILVITGIAIVMVRYLAYLCVGSVFTYTNFIDHLYYSVVAMIMVVYLRKKNKLNHYGYAISIGCGIGILVFIALYYGETLLLMTELFLLCLLILFRISYRMETSKDNVLDLTVQRYIDKQNKEKFEVIEKENQLLMQQMHDLKKHLQILDNMNTEEEAFLLYKQEIENKVEEIINDKQSTNVLVNRILQTYLVKFQKANVQCNIEMDAIDFSFMDVIDLSSILANMLDNALESCLQCKERFLLLKVKRQRELIIFKMKNSCLQIKQEEGILKTSKEDSLMHGYGMQNIARIAMKYEGHMQYHFDDTNHVFTTTVMINYNHLC